MALRKILNSMKDSEAESQKKEIIIVKKMALEVVGDRREKDRVYSFLRQVQMLQQMAGNALMGILTSAYYKGNMDLDSEEFVTARNSLTNAHPIFDTLERKHMERQMEYLKCRAADQVAQECAKEGMTLTKKQREQRIEEVYHTLQETYEVCGFGNGLDTKSIMLQKVKQDFVTGLKAGAARGEKTFPSYRNTSPVILRGRQLTFYRKDKEDTTFEQYIAEPANPLYVRLKKGMDFKVQFGQGRHADYLRKLFVSVAKGEYDIKGSSMQVSSGKIYLYLSVAKPVEKNQLDPNVVCGVSVGTDTSTVCVVNSTGEVQQCGDPAVYLEQRVKYARMQKRVQQEAKYLGCSGRGRRKKLEDVYHISQKERNVMCQYHHVLSRQIVQFAKEHEAGTIKLQDLTNAEKRQEEGSLNKCLLLDYLTYKCKNEGITLDLVAVPKECSTESGSYEAAWELANR